MTKQRVAIVSSSSRSSRSLPPAPPSGTVPRLQSPTAASQACGWSTVRRQRPQFSSTPWAASSSSRWASSRLPWVCPVSAAFESFQYYVAHGLWYGKIGGAVAGVAGFALTIAVLFPFAYIVVRYLTQGWLGAALRNPLVNGHQRVCSGIVNLVEELFQAACHTYGDATSLPGDLPAVGQPRRHRCHHLWRLGRLGLPGLCALADDRRNCDGAGRFVRSGRSALQEAGRRSGRLARGIVGGVAAGIMVHGSQPFGYWLSVPGGLVGAALTAGAVFPGHTCCCAPFSTSFRKRRGCVRCWSTRMKRCGHASPRCAATSWSCTFRCATR